MSAFFPRTAALLIGCVSWILGVPDWETVQNENCDSIRCSNIEDPVCGFLHRRYSDSRARSRFQNQCHLNRYLCYAPNEFWTAAPCETSGARRGADLSVVGATSVFCNHSCPNSCPDFYDPVCMKMGREFVAIANHCKVDMFSCTSGKNVSLTGFYMCHKTRPWFRFALTAKALKNLQLLEPEKVKEGLARFRPKEEIYAKTPMMSRRRSFLWIPVGGRGEASPRAEGGQNGNAGPRSEGRERWSRPRGDADEDLFIPWTPEAVGGNWRGRQELEEGLTIIQ